jgi:hypothetical protein
VRRLKTGVHQPAIIGLAETSEDVDEPSSDQIQVSDGLLGISD